jgi:hypothetical protein
MIDTNTTKLTLDRPARYQIKVPGELKIEWPGFIQNMTILVDMDQNEMPVSIVTGLFDQSALQGFLRHLYSLGIPLLAVVYLGSWEHDNKSNA